MNWISLFLFKVETQCGGWDSLFMHPSVFSFVAFPCSMELMLTVLLAAAYFKTLGLKKISSFP